MSPLGRYPADSFRTESAALVTSPELCFSVVRIEHEDWSFSEVDCLESVEIPLLGSVLLAGEGGTPYLYPYPTGHSVLLETENLGELDDGAIVSCESFLMDSAREHFRENSSRCLHKPAALGGEKYDLVPCAAANEDRLILLERLKVADTVILRGVNCLLKARMAFQHPELGEAGCIFLWIALDAAHSVVLEELRRTGTINPTSKDAARYFEKISGEGSDWENFFEDDYMNRIRAIHPSNRFGPEVIPQFLADDFLELYDSLIPLFDFLVSRIPVNPLTRRIPR
jgi:hypothetical protein